MSLLCLYLYLKTEPKVVCLVCSDWLPTKALDQSYKLLSADVWGAVNVRFCMLFLLQKKKNWFKNTPVINLLSFNLVKSNSHHFLINLLGLNLRSLFTWAATFRLVSLMVDTTVSLFKPESFQCIPPRLIFVHCFADISNYFNCPHPFLFAKRLILKSKTLYSRDLGTGRRGGKCY